MKVESKGFLRTCCGSGFPLIRGKKLFLNVRRRRWVVKDENRYVSRDWNSFEKNIGAYVGLDEAWLFPWRIYIPCWINKREKAVTQLFIAAVSGTDVKTVTSALSVFSASQTLSGQR